MAHYPSPRGQWHRSPGSLCSWDLSSGDRQALEGRFILEWPGDQSREHAGGWVQATEAGKGTIWMRPLAGQGSHLGVLWVMPVPTPMVGVGPSAFPKLPVLTGRDNRCLTASLPSPPPWTRCFLGFPAPEKVISQDLKNMALNHNLTRTQTSGAGSGNTYRSWRNPVCQRAHC